MSQGSVVSLPPNSQSTDGGNPTPAPTTKWSIWSRGLNKDGDWHCTHRFEDGTETYHYVNKNGTVYMKHRDGSATFSPIKGTYLPKDKRDEGSKIPAPTMEEIIEEAEQVMKEHKEYLASPIRYWEGRRTTPRRERIDPVAWLFPNCDCCDRFDSVYDYRDYDDYDDGYDYEPEYEPEYADYEAYGLNVDSEEDSDDDRSSLGPDEWKPMIKQEEDKTTVRTLDGARQAIAEEAQVSVKQEVKVKEEIRDGPAVPHPIISKIEPEETPASRFAPGPNASGSGVTGSGAGKRASPGSGVGPDVQAGKMILRSHRSKPY